MAVEKKVCYEPNLKCRYLKKYKCCGFCVKCPPEKQGFEIRKVKTDGSRKKF